MKSVGAHILLVAGGTGGHTLPCLALHGHLQKKRIPHKIITNDTTHFPAKHTLHLPVLPQKTQCFAFLKSVISHTKACKSFMHESRFTHIVLFGNVYGLPALLAYITQRISGQKCHLILHEQNALLGRMHRLTQFFAHKIALGFKKTQGISPLARHKAFYVGTPIRASFYKKTHNNPPASKQKSLLIVGGSQGANFFASQIFLKFLYSLDSHKSLLIYHQTPAPFVSSLRHFYQKLGVNAQVSTFFKNIDEILPKVDGVISRAGGSTLAEILACKTPAILIPYPFATDKHQKKNAQLLAKNGAALFITQSAVTPQTLSALAQKLLFDKDLRKNMRKNMEKMHRSNPCERICQLLKGS